jgi:hypothetical protein
MTTARIAFVVAFAIVFGTTGFAQNRSVALPGVTLTAVDRAGDFYAITQHAIYKFDSLGQKLDSVTVNTPVTLFDPGNGVRLLAYFGDKQEYSIYSSTLVERQRLSIDPSFAISPWLVCSSGDYDLMILDEADWSVKKVDTRRSVVTFEFTLDPALAENANFVSMREYLGFLFIHDRNNGILVFNRLGMKLRSIPVPGATSFNFWGEELYYYSEGKLHFTNLYTLETRTVAIEAPCRGVVLGTGTAMLITETGLEFQPLAKTF